MSKIEIKNFIPHIVGLILFALISCVYFGPQFSNKKLMAGDNIAWLGMSKEIKDYKEKTGEEILWTNSMFSGMPAYQIGARQNKNLFVQVKKIFSFGLARPAGMFILGMISFFILMLSLRINPWLGIIGAISFAFMTNNLVLLQAGHMTKIISVMVCPILMAGVFKAYNKEYKIGFLLFALGMGLNLMANHFQMTYYLGIMLSIYVLMQLYHSVREKTTESFAKASAILALGLLLAVGSAASKLWTTYEYSRDTMRGKPILTKQASTPSSSSNVEGLEWNYAMNWSNGWIDLLPSYIPMAVGGSSSETLSNDSNFSQALRKAGYNSRGVNAPLYWGGLPSTSGPIYFGAVMFFLFLFGSLYVHGSMKWWLVISVCLTMLLSLGRYFPSFNQFIFDYFPMYNKFRTPNSILTITALFIPLLGMLGLDKSLKEGTWATLKKPLLISAGALGLIALAIALLGGGIFDFEGMNDSRYEQMGLDIEALMKDRAAIMKSSAWRSFIYIFLAAAALYAFSRDWLKANLLIAVIGILMLADQFGVNLKYINSDSFVSNRQHKSYFEPRNVDKQIFKDTDPNFRVLDLSISTFESSKSSYHHKTIGGLHAAKLQRYQDLIDMHISRNNQNVLNMLNTKYIISGSSGKEEVLQNPAALGNAWFINNIDIVDNADEEIAALSNFDPAGDAIVHKEYSSYVSDLNPQKSGSISLNSYRPDLLKYKSKSDTEQLAVFSEIWYGPNKGWQAYIDGKAVDHIRANYVLRALRIPAGSHEVEFVFKPKSYFAGEWISLICSLFVLLFGGFLLFKQFKP